MQAGGTCLCEDALYIAVMSDSWANQPSAVCAGIHRSCACGVRLLFLSRPIMGDDHTPSVTGILVFGLSRASAAAAVPPCPIAPEFGLYCARGQS